MLKIKKSKGKLGQWNEETHSGSATDVTLDVREKLLHFNLCFLFEDHVLPSVALKEDVPFFFFWKYGKHI